MEQRLKDLVQALPPLSPVDDWTQAVVKKNMSQGFEAREEVVESEMKYFMAPGNVHIGALINIDDLV